MKSRINRREFIVLTSTAAAGMAAIAAASPLDKVQAVSDTPFVSVGFWDGPSKLARRFAAVVPTLQPASDLTTSDPSLLARGARLSLRGFFASAAGPRPRAISISVAYPAIEGTKPVYLAWASSVGKSRTASSNPVAFNVPVAAEQSIDIIVDRSIAGTTQRAIVPLALNPGGNSLRLNRGVYVFAVLSGADQATPSWAAMRVRDQVSAATIDPNGAGLIVSDSLFGSDAVPFDYFVLTVSDPPVAIEAAASETPGRHGRPAHPDGGQH